MSKTPEELAEEYSQITKAFQDVDLDDLSWSLISKWEAESFFAGYQAAVPQWISVKDRLPEEDVAVLVYGQVLNDPPDVIGVRRRYNGDQDWKHTWESEDGFIYQEDDVTHWMLLPKPPTKES